VRVGEPKQNQIYVKNNGKYPVKYDFTVKKGWKDLFTIEPMEGELNANEEKNIIVRFQSKKEIKLKTTKNTSDILMNIKEGKTQQLNQTIPINVNVNAVYSKYTITPLRNINFGPMQYGEQMQRTFEIKNEGLFEFKYAICNFNDNEAKAKIKEERKKEMEDRIAGLQEEQKEDPKAAKGKKPPPQQPAKGKGKGEPIPEGGILEVSQY